MDRTQVVVFGVAVVCALTLATAAASVAGSGETGAFAGSPTFDIEGGLVGDLLGLVQFDGGPIASVLNVLVYLPGLAGLAVIGYGIANYLGVTETGGIVAMVGLGLLVVAAFPLAPVGKDLFDESGTSGGGLEASIDAVTSAGPEITILLTPLVGGVLLVGLVVGATVLTRGDEREDPSSEPFEAKKLAELQGVGAAAGRAAEDLEDEASFENAIYEAWTSMARSLSVENRETTTPGEFAEAAVAAGLAREDVEELTRLFEVVRYGQTPVTDERRERAQAALERIEATYAGEPDE